MERLQQLEKVLAAAQRVLEAREYEMLTHVEWDALESAVDEATTEATEPSEKIPVQILFEDGMILVWDEDGDGIDCHEIGATDRAQSRAERQIDRWARKYEFDVADVKRQLGDYIRET
jgi:hypothetical protein